MKVTKGTMDGVRNKWNGLGEIAKRVLLVLVFAYVVVAFAGMVFAVQYELGGERYMLFGKVNTIFPVISLTIYKIVISVLVCAVYVIAFFRGLILRKRVLYGGVKCKITFDEENTEKRFVKVVKRLKTVVILIISVLIGFYMYKKEYCLLQNEEKGIILSVGSGLLFLAMMQILCCVGRFGRRFVVNPFTCLLVYAFHIVVVLWFVNLTSADGAMLVAGLLSSAFMMVLGISFLVGAIWFLNWLLG